MSICVEIQNNLDSHSHIFYLIDLGDIISHVIFGVGLLRAVAANVFFSAGGLSQSRYPPFQVNVNISIMLLSSYICNFWCDFSCDRSKQLCETVWSKIVAMNAIEGSLS